MANSKMTKKDWFGVLATIVDASNHAQKEELATFIAHEVELLAKKNSRTGMTKAQKENVGVMEVIKEVLADAEKPMTISEMLKDERLADYSNQKLSALLKQMGANSTVIRTEDKKKAYFSLA